MRLLSERRNTDRKGFPRQEPARQRVRNPAGAFRSAMPLFHAYTHLSGNLSLRSGGCKMTTAARAELDRRKFLKTAGALVVAFRIGGDNAKGQFSQASLPGAPPNDQVDSWIAIGWDNSITAFTGKEELGQGISTAQQQLVADELSVPFER